MDWTETRKILLEINPGLRLPEEWQPGANLREADLRWADLSGADLRGVRWDQDTTWLEGFTPPETN